MFYRAAPIFPKGTKWLEIEIRVTKNSPVVKVHIMSKNNILFMVQ
jgi:hypothetical protein